MIKTNERYVAFTRSNTPNLKRKMSQEQSDSVIKITKHKILDELLSLLENKRIRSAQTKQILSDLLHENTKRGLVETDGNSNSDVKNIESSIFRDVKTMPDYEIVRAAPSALFYDLTQSDETYLIEVARAVLVPNFILNALICESLEKNFTQSQILATNVFVKVEDRLRLDIDESHIKRGFIMPIINKGLINGLRVFRYLKDKHPFMVRARKHYLGGKK
jgi:hypothetical protein